MKTKILTILLIVSIAINGFSIFSLVKANSIDESNYYSKTTIVKSINREKDTITCVDFNGNEWVFEGCEDWFQGDYCSLLMFDNGTDSIYDDEIVKATYCGWLEGTFGNYEGAISQYE